MHPDSVKKMSGSVLNAAALLRKDISHYLPEADATEALVHLDQCELAITRYFYQVMDAPGTEEAAICSNCGRYYVGVCPEGPHHE